MLNNDYHYEEIHYQILDIVTPNECPFRIREGCYSCKVAALICETHFFPEKCPLMLGVGVMVQIGFRNEDLKGDINEVSS